MKILLLSIILLSGCSTLPAQQKFPEAPEVLLAQCPELSTLSKNPVLLRDLMKTVNTNYKKYHECSDLVANWIDWYTKQKKIFDDTNSN